MERRVRHVRIQWSAITPVVALIATCLLLAACGGATAHTTSTPTSSPTVARAANGCPAQQPPAGVKTPDVVVKGGGGADQQPVSLHVGQTLEIQLVDSYRWVLPPSGQPQVLAGVPGNGWHDAANHLCVWQFSASAVGQEKLAFTGAPICAPGVACPAYVLLLQYSVIVSHD